MGRGNRRQIRCRRNESLRIGSSHCYLASPRRRQQIFPGQVFGLRRFQPTCRTSQAGCGPVSSSAFVPAYRCGAVPESHRIPFSPSAVTPKGPWNLPTISGFLARAPQDVVDNSPIRHRHRSWFHTVAAATLLSSTAHEGRRSFVATQRTQLRPWTYNDRSPR